MGSKYSEMPVHQIQYSEKYNDDHFEYRHVILPEDLARQVPKSHLMTETEWRNLGVQQSPGWVHYMIHMPELMTSLKAVEALNECKIFNIMKQCISKHRFVNGSTLITMATLRVAAV